MIKMFSILMSFLLAMILPLSSVLYAASEDLSESRYRENLKTLSSDEFEGRSPSTRGEDKTTAFLRAEFRKAGVFPGNGESFFQDVQLISLETIAAKISVSNESSTDSLLHGEDILVSTRHIRAQNSLKGLDVVFVGYGIVAPEFGWNDYQGADVKGKVVLILNNDPGFLTENPNLFLGKGVTYYAKDSYKIEEAERQGARAAFIIQDSAMMKGDWESLRKRRGGARLVLDPAGKMVKSVEMEGWIKRETVVKMMEASGFDYSHESKRALGMGYQSKKLLSKISLAMTTEIVRSTSQNVIGFLPGTERPDEYIIYVAHWDHLGRDKTLDGDQIYNGARDNASGTAAMLELAHMFSAAPKNKRSIVFLAVTAEESGLLGSYYYTQNPIYPLSKTVGVMNMDMMNMSGRTTDVWVHGMENSPEMDDFVVRAVNEIQGRTAKPFGRPELGISYRSDSFSFNRAGVPVIGIASGSKHVSHGVEWMQQQSALYFRDRYHKVADEYDEAMDLSGAVEDIKALFLIGKAMANSKKFAQWYEGKEFKYLRDKQLQGME